MRLPCALGVWCCPFILACATPATVSSGPPPDWKLASASMSVGTGLQGTGGSGGQVSVQIDNHDLTGPTTHLYAGGGAIRGTVMSGRTVQVTIKGDRAEGIVGNAPFTCIVDTNPDGSAHVTGTMGARSTDFTMSPRQIDGRISGVTYNLTFTGQRYEGRMVPGSSAYLSLPAVMATWTNVEVACTLSVLLT